MKLLRKKEEKALHNVSVERKLHSLNPQKNLKLLISVCLPSIYLNLERTGHLLSGGQSSLGLLPVSSTEKSFLKLKTETLLKKLHPLVQQNNPKPQTHGSPSIFQKSSILGGLSLIFFTINILSLFSYIMLLWVFPF